MKKTLIVLAVAAALVFMFAAPAFADHSPTFYVEWSEAAHVGYNANFGNAGTGSPHQGYFEGTEKCGVCHSVHRAPVPGAAWDTNPADATVKTAVAGGQYNRAEFTAPTNAAAGYTTQMLLQTNVADSCDYCHIDTSIGGEQLYGGKRQYRTEGTGLAGAEWDAGFAHHNGCTGCHAVHGAATNYGNAALYGQYGVFKGAIGSKVLKVRAKGAGGAGNQAYVWQDELVTFGSAGLVEANARWAGWATAAANDAAVDPLNVPLFNSAAGAISGTNVRPGVDTADAQVSAFCTFCHTNYGYASEATVNPNGSRSLFQGPWYYDPSGAGTHNAATNMGNNPGNTAPFKNHPMKTADAAFVAAGKSATVTGPVAFANSDTCRTCHDAGVEDPAGGGVIIQSWPHFTPGYFHFTKAAAKNGDAMVNAPAIPDVVSFSDAAGLATVQAWLEDANNYDEAMTVADGQCLKCHVNSAGTAGVGLTF